MRPPAHVLRHRTAGPGLLLGLLLLAGVGCAGPTPTATPTPTPDPRQVLERTAQALSRTPSFRFTLEHEEGFTPLFPGLNATVMEGEYASPDRARVRVKARSTAGTAVVEMTLVVAGGKAFLTDPLSGRWREIPPETVPIDFARLPVRVAQALRRVQDPTLEGSESLQGGKALRIAGTLPSSDLKDLVPIAEDGFTVQVTVWVGRESGRLLRVRLAGRLTSQDPDPVVRVLTLRDYGAEVDVQVPEVR